MPFCIVQYPENDNTATIDDYQIWGVGITEKDAWNDAIIYLEPYTDMETFDIDDFSCEPMTKRLFNKIEKTGSPGIYDRGYYGIWDIAKIDD